jgi:hypothetical protein
MKQIIAILKDGSRLCYKIVADDFNVEAWAEKRKENFRLLGIVSIKVEGIRNLPSDTAPRPPESPC